MIKLEKTEVVGWEAAIRGMRNPMNSWKKIDSKVCGIDKYGNCNHCSLCYGYHEEGDFVIGPNDNDLMMKLANAGTDHRKFMRMIVVYVDITAPLYWWKEADTYKVGTVANSCSTMHKIQEKEFTLEDFSCEYLMAYDSDLEDYLDECSGSEVYLSACNPGHVLNTIIGTINYYRMKFIEYDRKIKGKEFSEGETVHTLKEKQKKYWWQIIQLLPTSYNQKRTVMLNYEVLANIYKSRKNHKLDEWRELCKWIESLPYSELIINPCEKKDLVEVTRCKNCEYYISKEDMAKDEVYKDCTPDSGLDGICDYNNCFVYEDDFCSCCKKKEEKE